MNLYKSKFESLSSDYLLELRARGDGLVDEAHLAIEEIFKERGEACPGRPTIAVPPPNDMKKIRRTSNAKTFALIVLAVFSWGAAKVLAHTWIGILVTILTFACWAIMKLHESTKSAEEIEKEKQEQKASSDGVTELMTSAAEGNVGRIKELIEYGHDPNQISLSGATALIYAARNNQAAAIKILLERGADPRLANERGQTAESVARTFGNVEALNQLKQA